MPTTSLTMDVMSIQSISNEIKVHHCEQENGISKASLVKELNHRWQTSDPIERLRTLCKEAKDSKLFEPSVTRLGITSFFTAEEVKQIKEGLQDEPLSSFEHCRARFQGSQPTNDANCHIKQHSGWCDNFANDPRLPPKRNPRTQRIVELNPSLEFHYEQARHFNDQRETPFTPHERCVATPHYWTNVEQRSTYRKEPFVPTLNDINAIINGACNIPLEWLNRQVNFMKSHQRDMMKFNDEWYALHCIRGCTYFNCAYVYYHTTMSQQQI